MCPLLGESGRIRPWSAPEDEGVRFHLKTDLNYSSYDLYWRSGHRTPRMEAPRSNAHRGLDLLCFSHILDDGREGCTRQLNFDLVGGYAQTHLAAIILSLRLSISRNTFENSLGENRFR